MSVFSPSLRIAVVSCAFLACAGAPVALHAQDQSASPASTAQDNSAQNKGQQTTADQQKSNTSDMDITKKIRLWPYMNARITVGRAITAAAAMIPADRAAPRVLSTSASGSSL